MHDDRGVVVRRDVCARKYAFPIIARLNWAISRFFAVLLLLGSCALPAWTVKAPVLYMDTVGYFDVGRVTLNALIPHRPRAVPPASRAGSETRAAPVARAHRHFGGGDGVSTARSPYYGAVLFLADQAAGLSGMMALQWLALLLVMWTVTGIVVPTRGWPRVAVIGATCLVAGAGVFASTLLPDVFAATLILAVAAFAAGRRPLSASEYLILFSAIVISIAFHKSHLLLAVLLLLAAVVVRVPAFGRGHGGRSARMVLPVLFGAVVLGAACHLAVDWKLRRMGAPVTTPPFLLARAIGDGTAERYLRSECRVRQFRTCEFLPKMPMTENQFLWSNDPAVSAFKTLDAHGREQVDREEAAIVWGTVTSYPLQQLSISFDNFVGQLFTVGASEYALAPKLPATGSALRNQVARYRAISPIRAQRLRFLSGLIMASYFIGWIALLYLLVRRRSVFSPTMVKFGFLVIAGTVANAAVCGVISGVFDRYQGRVAWLIPFTAVLFLCSRFSARPASEQGGSMTLST